MSEAMIETVYENGMTTLRSVPVECAWEELNRIRRRPGVETARFTTPALFASFREAKIAAMERGE